MAKSQISFPDGTTVKLEGTPDEIRAVIDRGRGKPEARRPGSSSKIRVKTTSQRIQLVDLITNLIDGGFFKKPKDLAAVKGALEELGHHYPVTTLSGAMLRQVRKRNLRRLKQDKRWLYTG
jgi:hypothetical protein